MKRRMVRIPFTASATILFLVISFNSSETTSAPRDPRQSPFPSDDPRALQELASWVVGTRHANDLRVMSPADLDAALDPAPRRFGLFREDLGEEARRAFLEGLPYGSILADTAERHRVDGLLLAAVVQAESGFSPNAVSPRGAVGLMQIRPATGRIYGARDLTDPRVNMDAGCRYLRSLLETYSGDMELALAAYNAGPAAVERYDGVPPFKETRAYVEKVLARYERYQQEMWKTAKGPLGTAG
jgi:soluble lytic murein transglycosylase-like protein